MLSSHKILSPFCLNIWVFPTPLQVYKTYPAQPSKNHILFALFSFPFKILSNFTLSSFSCRYNPYIFLIFFFFKGMNNYQNFIMFSFVYFLLFRIPCKFQSFLLPPIISFYDNDIYTSTHIHYTNSFFLNKLFSIFLSYTLPFFLALTFKLVTHW